MMPPLRNFDDVDGRERGQKKTDDPRAMTTLGPRTLLIQFMGQSDLIEKKMTGKKTDLNLLYENKS